MHGCQASGAGSARCSIAEPTGAARVGIAAPAGLRQYSPMSSTPPKDPLHGITLEQMLLDLVERYGWPELGARIAIRCFTHEPSVASSLKFLRRTDWARAAVERLYLSDQSELARKRKRNQKRKARRAHSAVLASAAQPSAESAAGERETAERESPEKLPETPE